MKKRPMWHTHVMGVVTIASAFMTYWAIVHSNIWAVALYAWFCGAAGMHVHRDFKEQRVWLDDPMRNVTVSGGGNVEYGDAVETSIHQYMCLNCVTPWKCNYPHHAESCNGWSATRESFEEDCCDCGAIDDVEA